MLSPTRWLERLLRIGTARAGSAWDARRVMLINGLALLTILLSWLSVPAAFLDARPEALPLNLLAQVIVGGVIWLNARGHPLWAASAFCLIAYAAVLGQVLLLGLDSGTYFWFVPILVIPLQAFPAERTDAAVGFSLLFLLTFIAASVTHDLTLQAGISLVWAEILAVMALLFLTVHARQATLLTERRVDEERQRGDRLLADILPEPIAERLLAGDRPADRHPEVTVVFADLVEFTQLAESRPADEVVRLLDQVFSRFDDLVSLHGLEKIKTIGDAYMVASGIPDPRPDHAQAAARLALALRDALRDFSREQGVPLTLRIGMASGPVVAGVIGKRRYVYDLWSDAVNLAARMESQGRPDRVQVAPSAAELLRDEFVLVPRGEVQVKGKGPLQTWWLEAAQSQDVA